MQSFYCNNVFDFSQIIKSQPDLQVLGIYHGNSGNIHTTLEEFHNAQLFLPIVFILERESFTPPDHITLYPMLYSVDHRATMHQLLAQSLCQDQGSTNNIRHLSIHLADSFVLAKNMAVSFPQIGTLNFYFERPCEIVSFLFNHNRTMA